MITAEIRYGLPSEYGVKVAVQEDADPDNDPVIGMESFRDLGYAIKRRLIAHAACDALIEAFRREVKPYEGGIYRQISMEKTPHKIKDGKVVDAFLNTHCMPQFPDFMARSIDIISDPEAQRIIRQISGWPPMLVESTFWESIDAGTPLHRDGDHINGAVRDILTAMWVALEDIAPDARLCLIPRSHHPEAWRGCLDEYNAEVKIPTSSRRINIIRRFAQGRRLHKAILTAGLPVIAPKMRKGDAIFWSGRVLHGSLPPAGTRYSVAGHYIVADDALVKHGKYVRFESKIANGMKLRIIPQAAEVGESKSQ